MLPSFIVCVRNNSFLPSPKRDPKQYFFTANEIVFRVWKWNPMSSLRWRSADICYGIGLGFYLLRFFEGSGYICMKIKAIHLAEMRRCLFLKGISRLLTKELLFYPFLSGVSEAVLKSSVSKYLLSPGFTHKIFLIRKYNLISPKFDFRNKFHDS